MGPVFSAKENGHMSLFTSEHHFIIEGWLEWVDESLHNVGWQQQ